MFDTHHSRFKKASRKNGFSMIELIVILAIIAILFVVLLGTYISQVSRARDADRKRDLDAIKTALEDYYNDNTCYPSKATFEGYACESDDFSPYMRVFPCDPLSGEHYRYEPRLDICSGYRIFTSLENTSDKSILSAGCTADGCVANMDENYGVAVGVKLTDFVAPAPSPTAQPTPEPTIDPDATLYACHNGDCNQYSYSALLEASCSEVSYAPNCGGCSPGETWCSF